VLVQPRSRLSDDAAEKVRRLIQEGGLRPGDRLPSERDLARQLGVARTSVREGLRSLEIVGTIEIIPGKGTFLRGDASGPFASAIRSWLVRNEDSIVELIELREAIESQAARLAAERATREDLRSVQEALAQMRDATAEGDVDRFVEADRSFHDAVARATRNDLVRRALASIAGETLSFRRATTSLGRRVMERTIAEHEVILEAITQTDPGAAARAMRAHILVWAPARGERLADIVERVQSERRAPVEADRLEVAGDRPRAEHRGTPS
jgi:GntR family transcriptional repressor for pyruvate dehydrogenase complex